MKYLQYIEFNYEEEDADDDGAYFFVARAHYPNFTIEIYLKFFEWKCK